MKKALILFGVALAVLGGCRTNGTDTTITPASTKVEQSHESDNPGTTIDRVIEIQINGKSTPATVKPMRGGFLVDGVAPPPTDTKPVVKAEEGPDGTTVDIGGNKLTVPKGDTVKVTIKESIKEASKKSSDKTSASSNGVGITTNDSSAIGKINTSTPKADLKNIGSGQGGDTDLKEGVISAVKGGAPILYIIGGILIVAGLALAIGLKEVRLGTAVALGGGAMIGVNVLIDQFPWVFLFIPLAVLGIAVYSYFHLRGKNITLGSIVEGVEATGEVDPAAAAKTKENIAEAAGANYNKVKAVVSNVKKKLNL